jgi:hypothetical protein
MQRNLHCNYSQDPFPGNSQLITRTNDDDELNSSFTAPSGNAEFSITSDGLSMMADAGGLLIRSESTKINSTSSDNLSSRITQDHSLQDPTLIGGAHVCDRLETLDFSALDLVCPINVDQISNRWLNAFLPVAGQKLKEYPSTITHFIYRVLKSYTAIAIRGRGTPPFVHSLQLTTQAIRPPLSVCLSLVRVAETSLAGSEAYISDIMQREMNNLYQHYRSFDEMGLLAAFQAYLLYAMVLFFRLCQSMNPFLRQAMMNLQELACESSRKGLMCTAEQRHARPTWESWIVAESKRRTLYTMYLFDSVLSAQDGLPTFIGTELQGLPAPTNKSMWESRTRKDWERIYNAHLADWANGGLSIDELWPTPTDLDQAGLSKIRDRVDDWLQDLDEFGTMLYAVTSCTHGD